MFPGLSGVVVILIVLVAIFRIAYRTKKFESYNLDPQAKPGAFEPLLAKYLRLAEFMIGLATGSIVLLVGSSAFHGRGGRLPWFYASPLLILAASVVCGLGFMAWLVLSYEEVQHGNEHTKLNYAVSETLGFCALTYLLSGLFMADCGGHTLTILRTTAHTEGVERDD